MNIIKNSIIVFIYYFVYIAIAFFLSPYLTQTIGVSQTLVGYLNAVAILLFLLFLYIFGSITDKYFKNKTIIFFNMLMTLIIFLGFLITNNQTINIVFYLLIWIFFMPTTAILDGLILKNTTGERYARVRLFGSLGAATGYFINSVYLPNVSYKNIFLLNIVLIIIMLSLIYTIKEEKIFKKVNYGSARKEIFKNPFIFWILIITFLTYGTLGGDDAFSYTYELTEVHLTPYIIGIVGFISIALEAFLMGIYQRKNNSKKDLKILVYITMLLSLIFFTKCFFYQEKEIIVIGDILMGVYTGLFIPLSIKIIDQNSSTSNKNTILGIYQISIKLGAAVVGLMTSSYFWITNIYHSIYIIHGTLTFIAGLLIIYLIKKEKLN